MRPDRLFQFLVAVVFGLGCITFGIVSFLRTADSERQIEAKLQSIRTGETLPEPLTVTRKYVNPGRGGLGHIIFSSEKQHKINITTTKDFFNSLNLGNTISGYNFPDGYFIPENLRDNSGGGKWFILGLGLFMGGGVCALAIAMVRRPRSNMQSFRGGTHPS